MKWIGSVSIDTLPFFSGYTYIMALPTKAPEQIVLFWTYNTPNVAMMTMAISFDRQSLQASFLVASFFFRIGHKKKVKI